MIKSFIVSELTMLFNCTEEILYDAVKRSLVYLAIYGAVMLLTFGIATTFLLNNVFVLGGMFSFLLGMEIWVLWIILGIPSFLLSLYYGAYFACKGWRRYKNN